jgi:Tfp pilus assembly pilus retraction ATPase PilT
MDTKKIFETLIELCINKNYSDLHLNSSHKAFIRNHYGDLEIIDLISID